MEIENDPYKAAQDMERAKHMTTYDESIPTCMYRKRPTGEIESKVFPAAEIPAGWYDSPAAIPEKEEIEEVKPVPEKAAEPVKRRPGRPKGSGRKVNHGNG